MQAKSKQKTILIVEDEREVLESYKSRLEEAGFEVLSAYDGQEGLTVAMESHPDLILLDIVLPKLDGIEVLRRLRRDLWGKRVPVMMITNLDSDKIVTESVMLGVYEYLVKSAWSLDDVVLKAKIRLSQG